MPCITVERTGNIFSIASSEYKVTYPNGSTETIWSPPWNDFGPDEEDAGALMHASKRWVEIVQAWIAVAKTNAA